MAAAGPGLAQGAGAYTADQAARGGKAYADNCALCHGADFAGGPGAPSLTGPEFLFGWTGKSVGALFTYLHDKMPPGQAGSLSDQDYADIAAAVLNANGVPAGGQALAGGTAAASASVIARP
jgi:mono/diheme cytochrome c family protein